MDVSIEITDNDRVSVREVVECSLQVRKVG